MGCIRTGSRWRWPNKIVPYTINKEDFPIGSTDGDVARARIDAAIMAWNSSGANITIQQRNGEGNYVEFVAGVEGAPCSSHVGVKQGGGRQEIPCRPDGGRDVMHEIGHALGLWHEQSREDRGLNVAVFPENIQSDMLHNYDRHVDDGTDVGAYNFGSLMHYFARGFVVEWRQADPVFGQSSKASPALASLGGELHLLHLGEDSNNIWHSWTDDGETWVENNTIPDQKSKAPPAVAVWNGKLHMVHLGNSSNDIWHSVSSNRRSWSDNVLVKNQNNRNMKSKAVPALTAFGGELHMVHIGDSSNDLWHAWTSDGKNWTEEKIEGQQSKAAPALAAYDGVLHLVHLGNSSNDLWHSTKSRGGDWSPNQKIKNQKSRMPPALCAFGGQLHMAHIGDESTTIWHSEFPVRGKWTPNDRDDNNESRGTPALAVYGGALHSVHLGKSSTRLWHTVHDTTLLAMRGPAGVKLGGNDITPGDIAAVNAMYP